MSNGDDFDFGSVDFDSSGINSDDLFIPDVNSSSNIDDLFGGDFDSSGSTDSMVNSNNSNDFFDDNDANDSQANGQSDKNLTRTYIIVAVAGILFVLLAIFIGSRVLGKKNSSDVNKVQYTNTNNNQSNIDANEVLGTKGNQNVAQNTQQNSSNQDINIKYQKDENGFSWMEVTSSENISYEEEYIQKTFSIDDIKHYARKVDADGTIIIKTVLSGSISGIPGTYTIEVPYSKGTKLSIHTSFNINVLFGEYNGKTVIVDITY